MALMEFSPGMTGGDLDAPEDATDDPDDGGDGEAASSVEEQEEFLAKGDVANDIRSQVTEGGMDTPVRVSTDPDTDTGVTTVREDEHVGIQFPTDAPSGGEDDTSAVVLDTTEFAEDDPTTYSGEAPAPRDTIDTVDDVVTTTQEDDPAPNGSSPSPDNGGGGQVGGDDPPEAPADDGPGREVQDGREALRGTTGTLAGIDTTTLMLGVGAVVLAAALLS